MFSFTLYVKILPYVLLLIFISQVNSQRTADEDYPARPDRCQPPIELLYRQCCILPPFFTREIAKNCGARTEVNFRMGNITAFRRRAETGCHHWKCVLNKYSLLAPTGLVDEDKYFAHLDKWTELNPSFSTVMMSAKLNCKTNLRHLLPLNPCEFYNFQACIRNFITMDCPMAINTPQCDEVKEFYSECREYFLNK